MLIFKTFINNKIAKHGLIIFVANMMNYNILIYTEKE